MAITEQIYNLSERKYSFILVLLVVLVTFAAATAVLFPNPIVRLDGISFMSIILVFLYLPVFIVVGFFYGSKNTTNPFSVKEKDRTPVYLLIAGIVLYIGITAGIYGGYEFLGYFDLLPMIIMYIASGKVGIRMYKQSWLSYDIEKESAE